MKREWLVRSGLRFEEGRLCEDGMFTMHLLLLAQHIVSCDEAVYCYELRPGSTVTRRDAAHLAKMIADFQYAIDYITELVERYRPQVSAACLRRLTGRRDSYIFFLQVRLLRAKVGRRAMSGVISRLRERGLYPAPRLTQDYAGWKWTLMCYVFRHEWLYLAAAGLYRVLR